MSTEPWEHLDGSPCTHEAHGNDLSNHTIPQHPSTPLEVVHDGVVVPLASAELPAVAARRRPLTCSALRNRVRLRGEGNGTNG